MENKCSEQKNHERQKIEDSIDQVFNSIKNIFGGLFNLFHGILEVKFTKVCENKAEVLKKKVKTNILGDKNDAEK